MLGKKKLFSFLSHFLSRGLEVLVDETNNNIFGREKEGLGKKLENGVDGNFPVVPRDGKNEERRFSPLEVSS